MHLSRTHLGMDICPNPPICPVTLLPSTLLLLSLYIEADSNPLLVLVPSIPLLRPNITSSTSSSPPVLLNFFKHCSHGSRTFPAPLRSGRGHQPGPGCCTTPGCRSGPGCCTTPGRRTTPAKVNAREGPHGVPNLRLQEGEMHPRRTPSQEGLRSVRPSPPHCHACWRTNCGKC